MSANWTITVEWESLDSGPPEERACFSAIGIQAQSVWLTEGLDVLANRLRKAPFLSAYHLAEWLAWNWWRLRWEPRSKATDWIYSHRLTTIGGGYIWPNLTIFSDGERTALVAKPTDERPQTPFRYIADHAVVLRTSEFVAGVDEFIEQVLQRLDGEGVGDTNLETIWKSVTEERNTPSVALTRKLEALLGGEPDETDPETLQRLQADAKELGTAAIEEVAADYGPGGDVPTAHQLRDTADERGYDASPRDRVRLAPGAGLPRPGEVAAWRYGAAAARALREQQKLDGWRISNEALAEMMGTTAEVLGDRRGAPGISFALADNDGRGRVVLRSKWEAGRRFELARLLGDQIAGRKQEPLLPATRAYTYRQKMQRSFAAEFLSPFEVVDEMLAGDYSMENQLEAAEHFGVSELTIRTLLVNHGRLEREVLEADLEAAIATQ
jgi:hypothetical protein